MTLEQKKEHSLRCIKLGMDIADSLFIAECTDEEMDKLLEDEAYLNQVKLVQKLEEMALLKKHNIALQIGIQRGNTKPIEWRLGKLNARKWGPKIEFIPDEHENRKPSKIVGVKPDGEGEGEGEVEVEVIDT